MTHLFNSVQRGGYRNDRHENYGCGIIVVVLCAPKNNAEELEDVERIQHLVEETETWTEDMREDVSCTKTGVVRKCAELTSFMRSLNREGTLTAISFSSKNNLLLKEE